MIRGEDAVAKLIPGLSGLSDKLGGIRDLAERLKAQVPQLGAEIDAKIAVLDVILAELKAATSVDGLLNTGLVVFHELIAIKDVGLTGTPRKSDFAG